MPPAMNVTPLTASALYSTRVTKPESAAPATSAGSSATNSISANRRASGRDHRPNATSRIFARYNHTTARIDPSWIMTVNTPPGSS